jgi:hypothetical protein
MQIVSMKTTRGPADHLRGHYQGAEPFHERARPAAAANFIGRSALRLAPLDTV